MASNALTANFPQITTLRGIHMVIYNAWDSRPKVSEGIFNVYDSRQYREHTQTVGGVGIMEVKNEGQAIVYDTLTEGFQNTFTHVDYAKGMRATRNMMRDELYGVLEDQGTELGLSAHATVETLLANHFNNGFNSNFTGPDGVELFATDHVREDGSTYRNELSSAADLSKTSLQQSIIDFRNFRDGGSKRIQVKPKYLLVPPDLQFTAQELTQSKYDPETDKNAINYLSDLGIQPIVWDYLTDTDAFFLLADKSEHKLVCYKREDFWTEHIYDFDTKDYKISGMFSQSSGWADPRAVFGSPGV